MTRSADELVQLYNSRRNERQPAIAKMKELKAAVNGDIDVPTPELDRLDKVTVANIIKLSLDQTAQRVASTTPAVHYAPLRPGIQLSENRARSRKLANQSWWAMNRMDKKLRHRARKLLGYGSTPVILRANHARQIPEWHMREPMHTYSCPMPNPDDISPDDCIFTYTQTLSWLMNSYGDKVARLNRGPQTKSDDRFVMLEYVDADELVLIVLGSDRASDTQSDPYGPPAPKGAAYVELERQPNRAGVCTAVVPGLVTLDRLQGAYDNVVGMYRYQAALMALDYIAVKKAVFPDEWVESTVPGQAAKVEVQADGLTGQMGYIRNGRINSVQLTPGMQTGQMLDRIERNIRVTSGSPAQYGAESVSNMRTGKGTDTLIGAAIDFPIQEYQEILADALQEENKRAVALVKNTWGSKSFSFYVPAKWSGAGDQQIDYVPGDVFENDNNVVSFAMAGADSNSQMIAVGQRIGIGIMSKRTGMMLDPMVDDPEHEHDLVVGEALEQAVLSSLQQQAAAGAIPPTDVAKIMQYVRNNKMELADAIQKVHDEAQARQATSGAPGTPEAPAPPGSPEAQPGIAQPGQGAEAGPAIAPPSPSQQNLAYLLGDLGRGARSARQVQQVA